MAKSLTTHITAKVGWEHTETRTGITDATKNSNSFSYSKRLTNGTAADKADLIYSVSGTIGTSATLSLDLAGTLADFFGGTITMARVKVIFVYITTATAASSVNVGGNANPLVNWVADGTDEVVVRNGGVLLLAAPDATAYAVTASTGDILDVTNNDGSNTATYEICIVGASA